MKSPQPSLFAFATAITSTSAHMLMSEPPSLRYTGNPFTGDSADYSLASPLHPDGSDYPCKGYQSLIGSKEGTPVASWNAGGTYSMTIGGGAPHGGGSCQASLSLDGGKTFQVVHSYIGGCPNGPSSSFSFRVPSDTPATENALLSWTWFNNLGNREMYNDCAVVNIVGGSSGGETVAFDSRPEPFTANIGNGCTTADSKNVLFPDPGPDVTNADPNAVPPVGNCQAAVGEGPVSSGSPPPPPPPPSYVSGSRGGSDSGAGSGPGGSASPASSGSSSNSSPGSVTGGSPGGSPGPNGPPGQPNAGSWKPGNDWPSGYGSGAAKDVKFAGAAVVAMGALVFMILMV